MITLLLTVCVMSVFGRDSPNAGLVEENYKSHKGRYSDNVLEDASLDVPGLISKYGYPVEVHSVDTTDGYILEMHRIPHGRDNHNEPGKRPVVYIMHGLLSSSADFLVMGPGSALGYHLAESGFDVWLGNARGNYYSRKHLTLSPDKNDFWKFSWDEIGNHDLPACIDYILELTGVGKMHYIGHSQGGTSLLVLTSLKPEYNEKIISFQGLAPASFFTHNENSLFNALAPYESIIEAAAWGLGRGEVFGNAEFIAWFRKQFCKEGASLFQNLCSSVFTDLSERETINSTILPIIFGHTPAGASIRQFCHYAQVIRFDAFRRYNHNPIRNLAVYGRLRPPVYDLSNITIPTYLYYGMLDKEVDYRDLHKLASLLPNVIKLNKMSRDNFNHYDFIWAMDAKELLYDDVVSSMQDADSGVN